jgi:hypothetical protein
MAKRNLTPAEKVFKAIATTPGCSRIEYAKATRLETPVVGRAFQTLKKDGLITMKGDRRGASYQVSRSKAALATMEELGLTITRTITPKVAKKAPKAAPEAPEVEPTPAPAPVKVDAPKPKRSHKKKVVAPAAPAAEATPEAVNN